MEQLISHQYEVLTLHDRKCLPSLVFGLMSAVYLYNYSIFLAVLSDNLMATALFPR